MKDKGIDLSKIQSFEHYISQSLEQSRIPGISIGVVKDLNVVYENNYGYRNIAKNLPVNSDTLFSIASCTKSFTALAIMQLIESKLIKLNDPVKKYLPLELGDTGNPITVHQLLSMSSGIYELGMAGSILSRLAKGWENKKKFENWTNFYKHINGASNFVTQPAKTFLYFNEGYTMLSKIVEKCTNLDFEKYMDDAVLKPLKMTRSTFLKDKFNKDRNRVTHYLKDGTVANYFENEFLYGIWRVKKFDS